MKKVYLISLFIFLVSSCGEGNGATGFVGMLKVKLDALKKHKEPTESYEVIKECKNYVKDIVESIKTQGQAQQASEAISKALLENDTFVFYDCYLLWLGGKVLIQTPPKDKEGFMKGINKKVANIQKSKLNSEVKGELSKIVAEINTAISKNSVF